MEFCSKKAYMPKSKQEKLKKWLRKERSSSSDSDKSAESISSDELNQSLDSNSDEEMDQKPMMAFGSLNKQKVFVPKAQPPMVPQ